MTLRLVKSLKQNFLTLLLRIGAYKYEAHKILQHSQSVTARCLLLEPVASNVLTVAFASYRF